ncbi:hypothetical protein F2Q69_00052458 [Brassica cretica]|uniref:Uncharacterized protein n=1 Tax=Brassica cretica TaxID=69181 RepID=A0A8S9MPH2_BRACR|nr:hypothetical protein F2Q69_00052458 [Brassica cretica]
MYLISSGVFWSELIGRMQLAVLYTECCRGWHWLEMKTPADKDKLGLVFLPSESPVTSLIQ